MAGTEHRHDGEETALETGQSSSFHAHLVNSLVTSSRYGEDIYRELTQALSELPQEGRSRAKRLIIDSIRKAKTMQVTHKQLAELVRGEDLDYRDLRRLREAEIYKRIKRVQTDIRLIPTENANFVMITQDLQVIMDYIKEDAEDGTD